MPEISGLGATRVIRAQEGGHSKHTRIIGLTAHARREVSDEAQEEGMDELLIKPIRMDDLYSAIAGSKNEPVQ